MCDSAAFSLHLLPAIAVLAFVVLALAFGVLMTLLDDAVAAYQRRQQRSAPRINNTQSPE